MKYKVFTFGFLFSNILKHIGDVQIPDAPTSIWDETRKSEYSQLYLDFAPYFQALRTEIGLEPCDSETTECDEPTESDDYITRRDFPGLTFEPLAEGVPAETLILDRRFYEYPYTKSFVKFVLQRTHKFGKTKYGKRHIDLLDFFRHAFRPHIYHLEESEGQNGGQFKGEYEQHMRLVLKNLGL